MLIVASALKADYLWIEERAEWEVDEKVNQVMQENCLFVPSLDS